MLITDPRILAYHQCIQGLHAKWKPHTGQIPIGKALFGGVKDIFVQAGRNFGKTELLDYCLWRWAQANPGSENYYFAPYMKQAREILWSSQRMQLFGPRDWIASINNTEMRITFKNGSFIKLDGSDNVEAYRGVKPRGLNVFDEFKDFRPEFYEAYDPNRAAHGAPLVIIGTPPDRDCQFTELATEYEKAPDKRFFIAPTATNPHIPKVWLEAKKAELYARGEGHVWEREYEAKFVKGGSSKIFPMLTKQLVRPHDEIMASIHRDKKKLQWFLWTDPAAATCFAVLFAALNPYTKTWYLLDEIYETDQAKMSVRQIGTRIIQKRDELYLLTDGWRQGYDEAETWFMSEMLDNFQESYEPSQKAHNDKESGLSLIKDIMLQGKVVISDRCKKLYWEADNYYKDANGKVPKKNDHLLDCLRYILGASYYSLNDETEPVPKEEREGYRGSRMMDDFKEMREDYGDGDDDLG